MKIYKNEIVRIKEPINLELCIAISNAINDHVENAIMTKDECWQVICDGKPEVKVS